jgi:hypothetical protein
MAVGSAVALAAMPSAARAQSQFEFFFPAGTALPGGNGAGGFYYDGSSFYTAASGTGGQIAKITHSGETWSSNVLVGNTAWFSQFLKSSSVTGSGTILSSDYTVSSVIGDLAPNPAPLTVAAPEGPINYAAGQVALMVDAGTVRGPSSTTVVPAFSKLVYTYDLRQVGGAAVQGSLSTRDRNGNGTADWNDAFDTLVTLADLQAVQGSTATGPGMNKAFAYATNGQAIYLNSFNGSYGGIWKVNLTTTGTAALTKVVNTLVSPVNTEPDVIHTSLRNLGSGAATGDQVLFQGSSEFGNAGGISYIVDNGASNQTPSTMLSHKQLQTFYEATNSAGLAADIASITHDASGNIYFSNFSGTNFVTGGLFVYDTEGRLAKIASDAEKIAFSKTTGVMTTYNVFLNDLKVREKTVNLTGGGTAVLPQVLYNDNSAGIRAPVGITAYKVGDFNYDNVVDATDIAAFKAALSLRGATTASIGTTSPWNATNPEKFKFDLNGAVRVAGNLDIVSVDWRDVKILQQFAGLSGGDVDMDFDVDADDLGTLASNYGGTAKLFTQGNLTSVRIANADKDDVNFADLVTLAAGWTGAKPALAAIGSIPQADLDRAFAITAGGTISEYKAKGGGTWGAAANWSNGVVPNSAGAVASLLTKPYDDVIIDVDAAHTVGQLNFDHAFSYTLSGTGTLTLQGAGGQRAEINTFAASPVINVAIALAADADVTVADAADTLTVTGGMSGAGGLTKRGAGKLLLQSNLTSTSALAVEGGTVEVATGGGSNRLVRVNNVTITAGRLDLKDNKLIVDGGDIGTATGGTYGGVTGLIQAGHHTGAWDGAGITTTLPAAATGLTALGVATADQADRTSFGGASVGGDDVLVMYTYAGDANLDGLVSGDDYAAIDFAIATPDASGWVNGDFNYDGIISGDDYSVIDFNIVAQGSAFPTAGSLASVSVVAVPEPAGALFAGSAAALIATSRLRRRDARRKRRG